MRHHGARAETARSPRAVRGLVVAFATHAPAHTSPAACRAQCVRRTYLAAQLAVTVPGTISVRSYASSSAYRSTGDLTISETKEL